MDGEAANGLIGYHDTRPAIFRSNFKGALQPFAAISSKIQEEIKLALIAHVAAANGAVSFAFLSLSP